MIVLDTNAISEALKPKPSKIVLGWLAAQAPREVFITAITQAELLYGIECMPSASAGRTWHPRRTSLGLV
jgi:predicted nucleic acid-binding protein